MLEIHVEAFLLIIFMVLFMCFLIVITLADKTCPDVPDAVFHAETVRHTFSAMVHGFETGSTAVTQCQKGFWLSANNQRKSTTCTNGEWEPSPPSCAGVQFLVYSYFMQK